MKPSKKTHNAIGSRDGIIVIEREGMRYITSRR
jgi:hypothetical protein